MSIGTKEGTEEEIRFVKLLNSDKKHSFWKIMDIEEDTSHLYAIHVRKEKYGKINRSMVKTKADVIICKGYLPQDFLRKNDYYLEDKDMQKLSLAPIEKTGVSVKRRSSYKYQILKMNPSTFKKIFGNTELGAGASIYCKNINDLNKNESVLRGWKTTWKKFEEFFSFIENVELLKDRAAPPGTRIFLAKRIKKYSNDEIHGIIDNNPKISEFAFQGVGNFDEPYIATWLYEKGELKKAGPIDFVVTTGSGRSHGDFTVVIKPKA